MATKEKKEEKELELELELVPYGYYKVFIRLPRDTVFKKNMHRMRNLKPPHEKIV